MSSAFASVGNLPHIKEIDNFLQNLKLATFSVLGMDEQFILPSKYFS
jgi:hypothetical protein